MRFLAKLGIKPGVLNGDGRMRGQGRKITYFLFAEFVLGCRDDIEDPNRLFRDSQRNAKIGNQSVCAFKLPMAHPRIVVEPENLQEGRAVQNFPHKTALVYRQMSLVLTPPKIRIDVPTDNSAKFKTVRF